MQLIAETAWHHQGDFVFMKELVTALVSSNANIIKLHLTLDLDEYMLKDHILYNDLKKFLFSEQQWSDIISLILSSDKKLMLLFNDTRAIEFGMQFEPMIVEIHSACLNDVKMLKKLKKYLKELNKLVLGIGGSTLYELDNALHTIQHPSTILMFGFQNYPTKYSDINLSKIRRIMMLYPEYTFGYADHTSWNDIHNNLITLLVAANNMKYIEKHVTIEYGKKRVDWQAAISIEMLDNLAEKLQLLKRIRGDGMLRLNKGEREYSVYGTMKKAAITQYNLNAGDIFSINDISFKRTSQVSDLSQVEIVGFAGKTLTENVEKNNVITKNHFQQNIPGKEK